MIKKYRNNEWKETDNVDLNTTSEPYNIKKDSKKYTRAYLHIFPI